MKKLFPIEETLANRITYYHILLFVILLPFDRFYTEIILISFTIHTLIHFKKKYFNKTQARSIIILQSVFFLTLFGALYTHNANQAFAIASRQLAIFLFPVLLLFSPFDFNKHRSHFFTAFAITCTTVVLYLYFDALRTIHYYHLPIPALFTFSFINHNFSSPIGIHATYLSMYIATSLAYFLTVVYNVNLKTKIVVLAAMAVLMCGLIQLGSRAVLISTILVFGVVFPAFYLKGQQRYRFIGVASFIIIVCATVIYTSTSFKERFFDELKSDLAQSSSPYTIDNPRLERWKLAWNLFKQAPVAGYGSGDEVDLLKKQYFENKLYNSYLFGLNTHNEYLSFLVTGGVIGLLVYLFTLTYSFRKALRSNDILFMSFLLLICTVSFSENLLDVNKGIFFYAFFLSLFMCCKNKSMTTNY